MYLNYDWIAAYLDKAPSLEEACRLVNETGLESEIEDGGLEVEHTVNRVDAMSHFGLARELAVKTGCGLVEPPIFEGPIEALTDWQISSDNQRECPQYMALRIDEVRAEPSPDWLLKRLESIGQTCHNVLVDLTNFLLWEFGHPSHAFDMTCLNGKQIRIRPGAPGERLTTLDGRDHVVEGLWCIADAERPVALAGVMGGQNSEVQEGTTQLLLELAVFRGATVRRSGRTCQIESDARHRFERGVDREPMQRVIRRFIYLLKQIQPQIKIVGLHDMDLQPFERSQVLLRRQRLDALLGIHLEDETVLSILEAMDCRPATNASGWQVQVPGYKVDVTREVDLIEEVIRFAGLDRLNAELPAMAGTSFKPQPLRDLATRLRDELVALGAQEICTYSFLTEKVEALIGGKGEPVRLRNPMSENQAVMRRNLLPGMLDCVRRNLNYGRHGLALFEVGHVFQPGNEPYHLAATVTSSGQAEHWWGEASVHPFYRVKGLFETLALQLGWQEVTLAEPAPTYLTAGEALGIYYRGSLIGGLGSPSAAIRQHYDFQTPLAVLELDLSFAQEMQIAKPEVAVLSLQPGIQVDMAFVLDEQHTYATILEEVMRHRLPHLEDISLFDVYQGKALGKGKKSLGFRFKFRAAEHTLTGEEVSKAMAPVVQSIVDKFEAVIRE